MAVDGVTLWMHGGVARLRAEARDPVTELRIAGVGPLTSLIAAVSLTGTAAWMDVLSGPGLAVECVSWLAAINFVLAAFNALPTAPLDGGRVLRAYLWHRGGDRVRAARGAVVAGRFLGWFPIAAATVEGRAAELRGLLGDMTVRQSDDAGAGRRDGHGHRRGLPVHRAVPPLRPHGVSRGGARRQRGRAGVVRRISRVPLENRSTVVIRDIWGSPCWSPGQWCTAICPRPGRSGRSRGWHQQVWSKPEGPAEPFDAQETSRPGKENPEDPGPGPDGPCTPGLRQRDACRTRGGDDDGPTDRGGP
ncbi:hypothetical protein GCM10010252_76510 [Streptomyces aureoverticillatus]|nr:hypothetical protein GCM10010252_76510 [Streptomyces aureoverticillatus]